MALKSTNLLFNSSLSKGLSSYSFILFNCSSYSSIHLFNSCTCGSNVLLKNSAVYGLSLIQSLPCFTALFISLLKYFIDLFLFFSRSILSSNTLKDFFASFNFSSICVGVAFEPFSFDISNIFSKIIK